MRTIVLLVIVPAACFINAVTIWHMYTDNAGLMVLSFVLVCTALVSTSYDTLACGFRESTHELPARRSPDASLDGAP